MSNSNGSQDGDDFITKIALVNLPTGRTTLSGQTNNNQSCWKPNRSGVFQVSEAYKTIQQTEILHELEIDSRNPTFLELSSKKGGQKGQEIEAKRPNDSNSTSKKSEKRNRVE